MRTIILSMLFFALACNGQGVPFNTTALDAGSHYTTSVVAIDNTQVDMKQNAYDLLPTIDLAPCTVAGYACCNRDRAQPPVVACMNANGTQCLTASGALCFAAFPAGGECAAPSGCGFNGHPLTDGGTISSEVDPSACFPTCAPCGAGCSPLF